MFRYRQPRRFNPVSFLLLLALLGAAYAAFMFGPPYWRKWRVKEVLYDTATRYTSNRSMAPDAKASLLRSLREQCLERIKELGVVDPAASCDIIEQGAAVTATVEYNETIHHPLVNKVTVLRLKPYVTREQGAGS